MKLQTLNLYSLEQDNQEEEDIKICQESLELKVNKPQNLNDYEDEVLLTY